MRQWLFMALVGAAYACAAHAPPRQRWAATGVMTAILITWALYLLSWSAFPPAAAFWAVGIPLTSEHLWALTDGVLGTLVIATTWDRWWGWMVFGLLALQQCFHLAYDWQVIGFGTLSQWLDMTFLAQLACFFVIGGPGVVSRLSDLVRVPRHLLRTMGAALRTRA